MEAVADVFSDEKRLQMLARCEPPSWKERTLCGGGEAGEPLDGRRMPSG